MPLSTKLRNVLLNETVEDEVVVRAEGPHGYTLVSTCRAAPTGQHSLVLGHQR